MSTVKISQLPLLSSLNANTSNSLFMGVDLPTGTTGKFTAHTLAQGLFSNEILNVGLNQQNLPNTVAQFALSGESYIQTNLVNTNDDGTADIVVTANVGSGGSDSTNFIDMGWANKNYQPGLEFNNIGNAVNANDGYLYAQGAAGQVYGNLIVGTTSTSGQVKFIAGGGQAANIVARMTSTGLVLNTQSSITFSDGSVQSTAAASLAYAQAAFASANTNANNISYQSNVDLAQNTTITAVNQFAQSAYNVANNANNLVNYQTGIDVTQNAAIVAVNQFAQSAYNSANTNANNISYRNGVDVTQNNNTQLAWNLANTAVQNSSNILLPGNVTFNGANTFFNSNIVTFGTMTTTGNVVTTGNLTATGPVTFNGNFINNGQTTNNGNTINNGNLTTTGNVVSVGYLTANGQSTFNGNLIINGVTYNNGITYLNGNTTTTGSFIMTNPNFAPNSFAIGIIGSTSGQTQMPIADGTMLQITGKDNTNSKLIIDAAGTGVYSLINGRSMRGLANTPSALLSGDILVKFGGNGYGTTGFGSGVNVGGAYMQYVAAENFSDTNKGTNIVFGSTPVGSNTITTALTISGNTTTANTLVANTLVYGSATANGMVTQLTSKSTAVTANGMSGQITMNNAALNHGTQVVFTVNNSYVQHVNDIPIVAIQNPITAGQYIASVAAVRAGSFDIMVSNLGAGPAQDKSDAIILNWALIRVGS